jgi:hypothetical protein
VDLAAPADLHGVGRPLLHRSRRCWHPRGRATQTCEEIHDGRATPTARRLGFSSSPSSAPSPASSSHGARGARHGGAWRPGRPCPAPAAELVAALPCSGGGARGAGRTRGDAARRGQPRLLRRTGAPWIRRLLEKMARASSLGSAAAGPAVGPREGSRSSSTPLNLEELGGDGKIP